MAKHHQRLAITRIAEALSERGIVEQQALRDAMEAETSGERPFSEALVKANHVGDWELSQVVCEVYGLPFIPIDVTEPDKELLSLVDRDFLQQHCIVPVVRYGKMLTVCMPGIVSADTLGKLETMTELSVMPVVGTPRTNRNWLDQNVGPIPDPALPMAGEWGNIFDQADAAVLLELEDESDL